VAVVDFVNSFERKAVDSGVEIVGGRSRHDYDREYGGRWFGVYGSIRPYRESRQSDSLTDPAGEAALHGRLGTGGRQTQDASCSLLVTKALYELLCQDWRFYHPKTYLLGFSPYLGLSRVNMVTRYGVCRRYI
jgi:hypothetical protein